VLTAFGVAALSFMMLMYALERRHRRFTLAFACGCLLSSAYGFLAGTWPFGVVEAIWSLIAVRRYRALSLWRSIAVATWLVQAVFRFPPHPTALLSSLYP
jgi:hypothetical protein